MQNVGLAVEKAATNLSAHAQPSIGPADLEAAAGEAAKKLSEELSTLTPDAGILAGAAAPTYVQSVYRDQGQTHISCDSLNLIAASNCASSAPRRC